MINFEFCFCDWYLDLKAFYKNYCSKYFYFQNVKLLSLPLFQKINNLENFFKNVLRAASAILGGPGHV